MTYLAPTLMPLSVERADWSKFARDTVRRFFTRHGGDQTIDAAIFMLVPAMDAVPFIGVLDEYEDEETLAGIEQLVRETAADTPTVRNSTGEMVLLFPLMFKDDEHKHRTVTLAKAVAGMLDAKATALVSECWLRGIDGARGTGEDSVMLLLEERATTAPATTSAFVARVNGRMPARSLGDWRPMPGKVAGALSGFLSDLPDPADFAETSTPMPRVNVSTVGEA